MLTDIINKLKEHVSKQTTEDKNHGIVSYELWGSFNVEREEGKTSLEFDGHIGAYFGNGQGNLESRDEPVYESTEELARELIANNYKLDFIKGSITIDVKPEEVLSEIKNIRGRYGEPISETYELE